MSKVLVVCAKRYNGHELWTALGVLQGRGHTFEVVSQDLEIRDELTLRPNSIERTVWEVEDIDKFDAMMVVSGNMADTEAYWDDKHVLSLIEEVNAAEKPLAAICCSVPTIRYAAEGKGVSFYPLIRSRERLTLAGAILKTVALTRDTNLVTAEHQMASEMWAEEFCNLLEGKPQQYVLVDSGFTPKGNERKPIPQLERIKEIQKRQRRQ